MPLRLLLALALTFAFALRAAETLPPAPQNHFNDYARLVPTETARQLNAELAQFERDTSTQLLVVVFPKMQSDSSLEDYTVRIFEAWRPGRRQLSNGAILFVFAADRRLRIATGYGLEATLPDALCKQIIENEIVPRFRAGDFTAGLAAGTRAMMSAVRGEYRGTGQTHREASGSGGISPFFLFLAAAVVISLLTRGTRRHVVYGGGRRRTLWTGPTWGGGSWGGGSWGGGGGGGGSFSGGGGSTGGGGASGSW